MYIYDNSILITGWQEKAINTIKETVKDNIAKDYFKKVIIRETLLYCWEVFCHFHYLGSRLILVGDVDSIGVLVSDLAWSLLTMSRWETFSLCGDSGYVLTLTLPILKIKYRSVTNKWMFYLYFSQLNKYFFPFCAPLSIWNKDTATVSIVITSNKNGIDSV